MVGYKDSPVIKKIKKDKNLKTKKRVRQDNAMKKYKGGTSMKKPMNRGSQRGK